MSSEPSKIQKVIAKINQLRAISNSTHSKNEKETTIALAAKLIAEYQLSEAELQVKDNLKEEIDFTTEHIIYETGRSTPWKTQLVVGLSELNGLFYYMAPIRNSTTHRRGSRYRVIGTQSNVDVAIYMFEYLTATISGLVDQYVPKGYNRGVNPEKESWCLGCVRGFLAKMKAEKDAVMKSATSSAMVLVSNQSKEVKEAFLARNEKFKLGTAAPSKAQVTASRFNSGYAKGQTLTVNPGMSGNQDSDPKKMQ